MVLCLPVLAHMEPHPPPPSHSLSGVLERALRVRLPHTPRCPPELLRTSRGCEPRPPPTEPYVHLAPLVLLLCCAFAVAAWLWRAIRRKLRAAPLPRPSLRSHPAAPETLTPTATADADAASASEGAVAYRHDLRLGYPPDGSELFEKGAVVNDAWEWTHGRRVGDTSLQLAGCRLLRLRLPSTLWPGGLMDEPLRTYSLTLDVQCFLGGGEARTAIVPNLLDVRGDGLLELHRWLTPVPSDETPPRRSLQQMRWHRVVLTVSDGPAASRVTLYVDGVADLIAEAYDERSTLHLSNHLALFGSSPHFVRLRRVELWPSCLDGAAVARGIRVGWAFSWSEANEVLSLRKDEAKRLQLAPLFGADKPPPLWHSPPFLAEFADPFLQRTGLDGSLECSKSFATLDLTLVRLCGSLAEGSTHTGAAVASTRLLQPAQLAGLHLVIAALEASKKLWKAYEEYVTLCVSDGIHSACEMLPLLVDPTIKEIDAFIKGGRAFLLLPAGWKTEDNSWYFVTITVEPEVVATPNQPCRSFRVAISNAGGEGMEWHGATAKDTPKIKHRGTIVLPGVRGERLRDEGFWTMLYGMSGHMPGDSGRRAQMGPTLLYETLLPWLVEAPMSAVTSFRRDEAPYGWRTPMYSNASHYRSILEAVRYMLLRGAVTIAGSALTPGQVKGVAFGLRDAMMSMVLDDLKVVKAIGPEDRALINVATRQLAFTAVKAVDAQNIPAEQLELVHDGLEHVNHQLNYKPQLEADEAFTLLEMANGETGRASATLFPYFDRVVWQDVRGKEGASIPLPKQLAIDFLSIMPRVHASSELFNALRQTEELCLQLSGLQKQGSVKHASFLKLALLEHVFSCVVPVPPSADLPRASAYHPWCFSELHFGQQLEILLLLARLAEHFMAASFSTSTSKSLDAVKLVVLGAMAAGADFILRQRASDRTSIVTLVLIGEDIEPELQQLNSDELMAAAHRTAKQGYQGAQPFGLAAELFLKQAESFQISSPEVNVTRSDVYNYFCSQKARDDRALFGWEKDSWLMSPTRADTEFSRKVAAFYYKQTDDHTKMLQVAGDDQFLVHNFEEYRALRDIVFWWKYCQCSDECVFPRLREYQHAQAQLEWKLKDENQIYRNRGRSPAFQVVALGKVLTARSRRNAKGHLAPEPTLSGLRWRTDASPNEVGLKDGETVETEDDVLHIKELPDFGGTLGQADSELLISYLTVPYMRLPLLMQFFASQNRLHTLASPDIRRVLQGVLLEPSKCEPAYLRGKSPQQVPAVDEEKDMLGTPYGCLLNECARAPHLVPVAMRELLGQALQLGKQSYHCKTTELIIFILGLSVRVESAVAFLLQLARGTHPSISDENTPGLELTASTRAQLDEHFQLSQSTLHVQVAPMLRRWLQELTTEELEAQAAHPERIDELVRDICTVHSFFVISLQNVPLEKDSTDEATWEHVQQLLTSFLFLRRRHTWNKNGLPIPEHELYQVMHRKRPFVLRWLDARRADNPVRVHKLLHSIFEAGTGTSDRATEWAAYQGASNRGRFAAIYFKRMGSEDRVRPFPNELPTIGERDAPVEINLQCLQVTMRGEFYMALDDRIAQDDDMVELFGKDCKTMQCAMTGSFAYMQERRLAGLPFRLQYWEVDGDLPFDTLGRLYRPDDLEPHEAWVAQVFQPCHEAYFTQLPRGPLKWFFHDREPLPVNANVAILTAKNPNVPGSWKEALVYRELRVVQVYRIRSHGRRYFRSLEYTSNALLSLHALQPSPDDRREPWPRWSRHEAMEDDFVSYLQEYEPPPHECSLVIIRERKRTMPPPQSGVKLTSRLDSQESFTQSEVMSGMQEVHKVADDGTVEEKPLPEDEWTPLHGTASPLGSSDNSELQEADEEFGRSPVQPPPPDVSDMLQRRHAKVRDAYDLLNTMIPVLQTDMGLPVYKVSDIRYYDKGIESRRNTLPCTCGLSVAFKGKIQFEITFKSAYISHALSIGWVTPAYVTDCQAKETSGEESKEEKTNEDEDELEGEEDSDDDSEDDNESDRGSAPGGDNEKEEDERKDFVGFSTGSWGLSPRSGKKWDNGQEDEFRWNEGEAQIAQWTEGEVISVAADTDAGELWYARNGQWIKAFDMSAPDGLCPAFTLDWYTYVGINWGEAAFSVPRDGFAPIAKSTPVSPPELASAPHPGDAADADADAAEFAAVLVKSMLEEVAAGIEEALEAHDPELKLLNDRERQAASMEAAQESCERIFKAALDNVGSAFPLKVFRGDPAGLQLDEISIYDGKDALVLASPSTTDLEQLLWNGGQFLMLSGEAGPIDSFDLVDVQSAKERADRTPAHFVCQNVNVTPFRSNRSHLWWRNVGFDGRPEAFDLTFDGAAPATATGIADAHLLGGRGWVQEVGMKQLTEEVEETLACDDVPDSDSNPDDIDMKERARMMERATHDTSSDPPFNGNDSTGNPVASTLPNKAIDQEVGKPVAWATSSQDGSLTLMKQSGSRKQWWTLQKVNAVDSATHAWFLTLRERLEDMMTKLNLELERTKQEVERAAKEREDWEAHLQKQRKLEQVGQLEQYLPSRLLHGLVPAALLESHDFYQDLTQPRLVRGYPLQIVKHDEMTDAEQKVDEERRARNFRLWPQERSAYPHIIKLEIKTLAEEHPVRTRNLGCRYFARVIKKTYRTPAEKARGPKHDGHFVLLSLLSAAEGSQLLSLARTLSRIEPLSHVLAWTKRSRISAEAPWSENKDTQLGLVPDLIEMPRLNLTLRAEKHGDEWRLYSVDHSKFYVLDAASEAEAMSPARQLAACCPHALILRSENAEYCVVVPNVRLVRPAISSRPFSTEVVLDRLDLRWARRASTSYFTFGVHVSGAFLTPPTLASALYLLVLRLIARDYEGASALFSSISTDSEMTAEELQIFDLLGDLHAGSPDFHAIRAKVMLTHADAPTVIPWDIRQEQALYISKLSHISARCRLSDEEERVALQMCVEQKEKLLIVKGLRQRLDSRKLWIILSLIQEERNEERHIADRKPLTDFLQTARVAFHSKSLRCSDKEIMNLFMQLGASRDRIECTPNNEMALYNRQQLLETLQEQQALHDGEPRTNEAPSKSRKSAKKKSNDNGVKVPKVLDPNSKKAKKQERRRKEIEGAPDGFIYCHCKSQSPLPPSSRRSAWICRKDDTAASGDYKEEFSSGAITYNQNWITKLPAQMLSWIRIMFDNSETVTGSQGLSSGFLIVYELFTCTKEVMFRGKATEQQNHTFATLFMRFIEGVDDKGLMQSIMWTLARNPWVCSVMPKWSDTRSDSWNSCVRYSGWKEVKTASDFVASDEDPFSRLLFNAQETLQQLKVKGYLLDEDLPPCGFVPPVVLPDGYLLLDTTDSESGGPPRSSVQPPHSGTKKARGSMRKPSMFVRLALKKCPSTKAKRGEVLRWQSGVLGLQQRTHESCSAQTDYLKSVLTLREVDDAPLSELLGAPLAKFNSNVLQRKPEQRPGTPILPINVEHHPEAQSINAKSCLKRLVDDHATYFDRPIQKVHLIGRALNDLTDADSLIAAENALLELKGRLRACGTADRSFISAAHHELLSIANDLELNRTAHSRTYSFFSVNDRNLAAEDADAVADRLRFSLLRHSGHESEVWFEYMVGCLLSSRSQHDLHKLNPFVTDERWSQLLVVLAVMLLRSNRVVQANAASEACDSAISQIDKMRTTLEAGMLTAQASIELQLKLDALCTLIMTERAYSKDQIIDRARARASEDYMSRMLREASNEFPGAEKATVDPRFLVFEFLWSLQLRARQESDEVDLVLECVDSAQCGGSIVKQMIMGAGKTSVVSPLICLMLAQGDSLVLQCVPPALLPMTFNVLRTTFSSAIQERVYTFHCERSTAGKRSLQAKLLSAKENRSVVITTPPAIKSLMLKFVENLTILTDDSSSRYKDKELRGETHVWAEILELFRHGVCIMDEVDWVLHPLKSELNFPIGEKNDLHFTKEGERWRLPMALFDVLLFAQEVERGSCSLENIPKRLTLGTSTAEVAETLYPILQKLVSVIRMGFEQSALQRTPHMILLREDFYEEPHSDDGRSLKQLLASWLLSFLRSDLDLAAPPAGSCNLSDMEILEYISSIGPHRHELRLKFNVVKEHGRCMLNLAADWINQFLPHALKKIDRVTFGIMNEGDLKHSRRLDPLMPRSRAKLAIPFISKDVPAPASEFAQPDVVIGLTILAFRLEGLRMGDFTEALEKLIQDFEMESGPFDERRSAELFSLWITLCGGIVQAPGTQSSPTSDEIDVHKRFLPLQMLDRSDPLQIQPLFELFRVCPEFIYWYLHEVTFPNFMRFQEEKLSASGQDMGGSILFSRRIGFSGTPSDLLPREFGKCHFEAGSEGEILHTLTSEHIMSACELEPGWSAESVLAFIATAGRFHALIDVGAIITGLTNLEVAAFLVREEHFLPGVDGVVYLDKFDRKMIFMRDSSVSLRLEESSIRESRRFCFYDQMHTTGMDIRHRQQAHAAITIGKDTTWRDYAQGAFRMRGILTGQTVEVLLTPEVAQLISRDLAKNSRAAAIEGVLTQAWASRGDGEEPGPLPITKMLSPVREGSAAPSEELVEEATKAILLRAAAARVVLFTREQPCPLSDASSALLHFLGVPFEQALLVDVRSASVPDGLRSLPREAIKRALALEAGFPFLPQLYIDGRYLCGGQSLIERVVVGSFHALLEKKSIAFDKYKRIPDVREDRESCGEVPRDVASWLQLQQLRSEKIQFQMLQLQNLADVWRNPAFRTLLSEFSGSIIQGQAPAKNIWEAIKSFKEPVGMTISTELPVAATVQELFDEKTRVHWHWVAESEPEMKQKNLDIIQSLVQDMSGLQVDSTGTLEQCMECEHQKEQQKELEQQTEMEKYVDVAYSRDGEAPTPWLFEELKHAHGPVDFYRASAFKLHRRKPLRLCTRSGDNEDVYISSNYFNPTLSGERRLRNVIMLMEWIPDRAKCTQHCRTFPLEWTSDANERAPIASENGANGCDLRHSLDDSLDSIRKLLPIGSRGFSKAAAQIVLSESFDRKISREEVHADFAQMPKGRGQQELSAEALGKLLRSPKYRCAQDGRHFVLVSLAEAETIRRVLHAHEEQSLIDGATTSVALRNVTLAGATTHSPMDASHAFDPGPQYQRAQAIQLSRFIDGQMMYEPFELSVLLKCIQHNTFAERQAFFTRLAGCRRRYSKRWGERPIAALLRAVRTEFDLLSQRVQARALRIAMGDMNLDEVFARFNVKKDQKLSAEEIFEMLVALKMPHEPREIIRFLLSADKDGDQQVSLKDFKIYVHSFAVGDGEPEDAEVEPILGPQRQITPLLPSSQRSLSAPRREESEGDIAALKEQLRVEMDKMRADIAREEEQREYSYESMVAEMKENCGSETARNPLFMVTENKWLWDFQVGTLPRLVVLLPKDLKFSPVAEPSPKLKDKFFLQLQANGSLALDTSHLHTDLRGETALAWARDVAFPRVNRWSTSAVFRISEKPASSTPFELLTLLRDPADDAHATVGSLVVHLEGWLGLSTSQEQAPDPPSSSKPLELQTTNHSAWPLEWQRHIRCFPARKKIVLDKAQWNIITLSVDLPTEVSVFLNGERVLQLSHATIPRESTSASTKLIEALSPNGPFSLDTEYGLRLFGQSSESSSLVKDLRAITLSPQPASTRGVWAEHNSYGAWRCQAPGCHQSMCEETSFNPSGLRNGPDAMRCAFCGKARLRSQEEPRENPCTTDHPGLWTVTATNFHEVVLRAEENVFLLYTADWCPPCRAMKPEWYKLAKLLQGNPDVKIASCDTDANECDSRYYWEGSIPTIKLFIRGEKNGTPLCYRGERNVHDFMQYLARHCKTSTKGTDLLKLQYGVYAEKQQLPRRLEKVLGYFVSLLHDRLDDASTKLDVLINWERVLASLFADPEAFGIIGVNDNDFDLTKGVQVKGDLDDSHHVAAGQEGTALNGGGEIAVDRMEHLQQLLLRRCMNGPSLGDSLGHDNMAPIGVKDEGVRVGSVLGAETIALVKRILAVIESHLCIQFPDTPFSALASCFLYSCPIRLHGFNGAPEKLANVPSYWKQVDLQKIVLWTRAPHADVMSQQEVRRAWPELLSVLSKPAELPDGPRRSSAIARAADHIRELALQGMPLEAAPFGFALAHIFAGYGASHARLLNQLFWSNANMSRPSYDHQSLPIEIAAMMGHAAVVSRLYAMGCSLGRALFCAIRESQLHVVETIISETRVHVDQRWSPSPALSPLELAVILGNREAARMLLKGGARVDRPLHKTVCTKYSLTSGSTVVHLCAKLGDGRGRLLEDLVSQYSFSQLDGQMGVRSPTTILSLMDHEGKTPLDVVDPRLASTLDAKRFGCWDVLYETLLSPTFDHSNSAIQRMCIRLREAVDEGAGGNGSGPHAFGAPAITP
ncbi:hypothetical protein AB1Y20_019635 [Prymnesium parvum]|uniref:ubiquitinyl hydrolase 1 n=1 Tax=Prymnesium parvum TaxID=97485 RepID=A0AB34JUM4_PRYPA